MGGKLPSCRTNHPLGKQAASRKPSRKNAQRRTSTQPQEPKPPSTAAKPQSPRKPGRRRMNRTGSQRKQPQPEPERGEKLQKQEPRRPGKPETRRMPRGGTTERRSRPRSIPEYLHKWKRPFQPGGNKSTQRQTGSQGETWRARKKKLIQFQASLRVKTVTTGGTERWPKEGGGTTRLTVSKSGIDINPGRATSPKKLARLESDI